MTTVTILVILKVRGARVRTVQTHGRSVAVVLLVAGATSVLLGSPASGSPALAVPPIAEQAAPQPVATNWWWAQAAPTADGQTLPVGPPAAASGVGAGDLGVGYQSQQVGNPDKVAAVAFDLRAIPLRATFSQFRITVPLDPAAQQIQHGVPDISACEAIEAFQDGAGPGDLSKAPQVTTPSCVQGVFDAKLGGAGSYVFELTAIANDWAGGTPNNGVVLRPTISGTPPAGPYTLSLLGKKGITAAATFVRPVAPVVAAPPVTAGTPPIAPAPFVPSLSLPPLANFPDLVTTAPTVALPLAPAPQLNPAPRVSTAGVRALPVSVDQLRPAGAFWWALAGGAALLGLTALVLGDPLAPAPVDSRRRRFAAVVRTAKTPAVHARPTARVRPV